MATRSNIVLIGMPGAGKSTVGVLLAKLTARDFVDTDLLIQHAEGRTLQSIVDAEGYLALRAAEERVLLGLQVENSVIATGGSAAYSERAMRHLRQGGVAVFLDVDLATLRRRVSDYDARGIARRPDQSFADLFQERFRLYTAYADHTVSCAALTADETARRIARLIGSPAT
jgi:shikimate kinase